MEITKCDICKKIKKDRNEDKWIRGHILSKRSLCFDLCEKCSVKPLAYLEKYLKIKEKEKAV